MRSFRIFPVCLAAFAAGASLSGQTLQRVRVTAENLAPVQGTFKTPLWIGFHDGSFDLYDPGVTVSGSGAPVPNNAMERLAEDGDTSVLAAEFLATGAGLVEGSIPGPSGPYAPGETGSASFLVDPSAPTSTYFSYATMLIPSNDAFLANGDPLAHKVFDQGVFVEPAIFTGPVLDAGSEVNDEVPANTAFFGQTTPNTGVPENGIVTVHPGFKRPGSGGILDDPMFFEADFIQPGYPTMKIRLEAAVAITDPRLHEVDLSGRQEVPPVQTPARGFGVIVLDQGGTRMGYLFFFVGGLRQVTAAHLHLGRAGENGPVVVDLLAGQSLGSGPLRRLQGQIRDANLTGPLSGVPLDELTARMEAGEIYVNVHTQQNPGGEIRGQVQLVR